MGAKPSSLKKLHIGEAIKHVECTEGEIISESDDYRLKLIKKIACDVDDECSHNYLAVLCNYAVDGTCYCLFEQSYFVSSEKNFGAIKKILPHFYSHLSDAIDENHLKSILIYMMKHPQSSAVEIAIDLKLNTYLWNTEFMATATEEEKENVTEKRKVKKSPKKARERKKSSAIAKELIKSVTTDSLPRARSMSNLYSSSSASSLNSMDLPLNSSFSKEQSTLISNNQLLKPESAYRMTHPVNRTLQRQSDIEQLSESDDDILLQQSFDYSHENDFLSLSDSDTSRGRGSPVNFSSHSFEISNEQLEDNNVDNGTKRESVLKFLSKSHIHRQAYVGDYKSMQYMLKKGLADDHVFKQRYPIHTAVYKNHLLCVKALIEHNRSNLTLGDKKRANTPLHYANSQKMIAYFVSCNVDVNARNSVNETTLHVLTKQRKLSLMIYLLTCGADVNAKGIKGKTALHYAFQMNDPLLLKALLIFGADQYMENDNGNSVCAIADEVKNCSPEILEALKLYATPNGSFESYEIPILRTMSGAPKAPPLESKFKGPSIMKQKTGKEAILCLDGGGIRGLMTIEMLMMIGNLCGRKPMELFDWIAGTSTGAFLGLLLAQGANLREIHCGYFRLKQSVFSGRKPYDSDNYEALLKDSFGETTMMSEISYPRVIVNAVAADCQPAELHVFCNYDAKHQNDEADSQSKYYAHRPPSEQVIWKVARHSTSAPLYFRPMGDSYIDGGLIANNPTVDALREIQRFKKDQLRRVDQEKCELQSLGCCASESNIKGTLSDIGIVLSLGTGQLPPKKAAIVDLFRPNSLQSAQKVYQGLKSLIDLLLDQATCTDAQVAERGRSWCESLGIPYFRFNPVMISDWQLDEQDDKEVVNMLFECRRFIIENIELFRKVSVLLMGNNATD